MSRLAPVLTLALSILATSCGGHDRGGRSADEMGLPDYVVALCGNPTILGTARGDIDGGAGAGCGIDDAVQVYAVSGVVLSTPATLNCAAAKQLNGWVREQARPTLARFDAQLVRLRVAASYVCRSRNGVAGARISEHARGKAIDISAFGMADGREISVLKDWDLGERGTMLRRLHRSACGPYGTVLGPEADRYHRDHFHFDIARYSNGTFCQ